MSRYCLLCLSGLVAKHTLVSDPSPFNTWRPEHAHQFVTYESAERALNSVRHIHPEISIVQITFTRTKSQWIPTDATYASRGI